MSQKLSTAAFSRFVRLSVSTLEDIDNGLKKIDVTSAVGQRQLASYDVLLKQVYADMNCTMDVYTSAETLPKTLTEDNLDAGIKSINSTYFRIFNFIQCNITKDPISTASSPSVSSTPALVSLPKFDIPKFSGKFCDWANFYARFNSLIHANSSLSNTQKFQFLLSLLEPTPLKIIDHLSINDVNYVSALECLKERFHNPRRLITSHCENLLHLPTFDSKSANSMRQFLDIFNADFKALENIPNLQVFEAFFTTFILNKLDHPTKVKFESSLSKLTQFPTLKEVRDFLKVTVIQRENTTHNFSGPDTERKGTPRRPLSILVTSSSNPVNCPMCQLEHKIYSCPEFLKKSPQERFKFIKNASLCVNCLGSHQMYQCSSKQKCKTCQYSHHSLLHFGPQKSRTTKPSHSNSGGSTTPAEPDAPSSNALSACATSLVSKTCSVLMSTCLVRLQVSPTNYIVVRAVLDSASHISMVTEKCTQLLQPRRSRVPICISGVGHKLTKSSGMCHLSLTTLTGDIVADNHSFIVMPQITSCTPIMKISPEVRRAAASFVLADPSFDIPSTVDVLLGADITAAVIQGTPKPLGVSLPFSLHTRFGTVLIGEAPPLLPSCNLSCADSLLPLPTDTVLASSFHADLHSEMVPTIPALLTSHHDDLLRSVQRFWESEEPPPVKTSNQSDTFCEQFYANTTSRTSEGRYVVRLPLKESPNSLGNSYSMALTRLRALERRFKANPDFKLKYIQFMRDYETQHHMRCVDSDSPTKYFIPHHGIFKNHGDTSKLRVVFDASSPTSTGTSLNDILYAGPKLQTKITDVITLFRQHLFCFVTDICQMYRQILIHQDDQPYQCILWRESPHDPVKIYYLTTVTYGISSAPYLALRTLLQLSRDEGVHYPLAAAALCNNTFVDDIVVGASSLSDAVVLRDELISLLSRGGFSLKKWVSNHPYILNNIPEGEREHVSDNSLQGVGLLGLSWIPSGYFFRFSSLSSLKLPSLNDTVTKRSVLALIAQLYDPCGWLSPVIMKAKCFLQQLWLHPLDWDSPLPSDLVQEWHSLVQSLPALSTITVKRPLSTFHTSTYQLHGFSDASQAGYAAVLYLRSVTSTPTVTLLASKTRVTPTNKPTIPRLELMGAHLLSQMMFHYRSLLTPHINIDSVHLWSDSTIVLDWLKIPPLQLKMFVGNRVAQILEWSQLSMWRHVSGNDNPADVASRGIYPTQLSSHPLWWTGPSWLLLDSSHWPQSCSNHSIPDTLPELSGPNILVTTLDAAEDLFARMSVWPKIIGVVTRILSWLPQSHQFSDSLVATFEHSFIVVCRYIQLCSFSTLFDDLQRGRLLHKSFQRLSPFVDDMGVIRIRGRILHSDTRSYPILLPKGHRLVSALIDYYHQTHSHAGTSLLYSLLCKRVWILSARQIIRSRVFHCVRCFRAQPSSKPPLMGNLPSVRVTPSPPFYHSGMDFAGPFSAKLHHLRKSVTLKVYLCIFVCFSSKAVHLELATDLSTSAFLDVLKRFIGRRSAPAHLYSDCGTNFKGASARLKEWDNLFQSSSDEILQFTSPRGICFNFLPPAAPHQGGLWERAVKSAKFHLTRVLGSYVPTVLQLSSLFIQVEAILNSRPLVALSSDPDNLDVLTPGHFLVGRPLVAPPEPNLQDDTILNKFNAVQALTQQFWTRWKAEYLPSLRPRAKWCTPSANLRVGDLVILQEPHSPPVCWPVGRVIDVYPGADSVVRRAKIRAASGEYIRPAVRLFPLPNQTS